MQPAQLTNFHSVTEHVQKKKKSQNSQRRIFFIPSLSIRPYK